jgi:hypothetical protein
VVQPKLISAVFDGKYGSAPRWPNRFPAIEMTARPDLVVVKIVNIAREWGFCLRFVDKANQPGRAFGCG